MSHAMYGHPREAGHGGEFWQNMAHWRRKWQTTSVSCLENPMNSMKSQKDLTLKDELPKSVDAIGEKWRNSSRKNEEAKPKKRQHLVWMWRDGSKVQCSKEQYRIGTWNVKFMNQGKLEVVKQEMSSVNINILGISELKWVNLTQMNRWITLMATISTTVGKNPLEEME